MARATRSSRLLLAITLAASALVLPGLTHAAPAGVYVVRSGDSLSVIAMRLDVRLSDLLRVNNLTVRSVIHPGQELRVPGASGGGSSGGSGGTTYTVQPGDWLSRIASRNDVTLSALLAANQLRVTSLIIPGQRLVIPGPAGGGGGGGGGGGSGGSGTTTYTVRPGDWLSRIASRHGITLAALLAANNLTVNSLIVPGQQLRIPRSGTGGSGGGGGGGGSPTQPPPTPPAAGPSYTVREGDSLGAIATQHNVALDALLAVNGFVRSTLITPGMTIKLPAGARLSAVDRLLNYALAQVGKPYKFWSRGPEFFDCSGLTLAAYAQIGVSLIHYSAAQATQGTEVDFINEPIRAGDLVFQDTDGDGIINHVGIALNATSWVQARSTRQAVSAGPLPSASHIVAVRRFLPAD